LRNHGGRVAELRFPAGVLEDAVVRLRPWRETDVRSQLEAFSDPWFQRFSDWAPRTEIEVRRHRLEGERARRRGERLSFALVEPSGRRERPGRRVAAERRVRSGAGERSPYSPTAFSRGMRNGRCSPSGGLRKQQKSPLLSRIRRRERRFCLTSRCRPCRSGYAMCRCSIASLRSCMSRFMPAASAIGSWSYSCTCPDRRLGR
jgi:hypothetical protein